MASTSTFHCAVVTPERSVLETDAATFVALPASDGEIGILVDRAPLIARLAPGELRVTTDEGETSFYVDGGFAELSRNRLTVLTEGAADPADLDRDAARSELDAALSMPSSTDAERAKRDAELARARAKISLAP